MGCVFSRDRGRVGDGYKGTGRKVNKANPCEGGGSSSNHEDDGRHEDEGHDDDGGGNVNIVMTEDYQSLKRRMREVEDCLECSACFMVPRKLPIPSCPSGHLICSDCRGKVEDKCPTCRRMLRKGDVSSLAAALYVKVEHRCKFIPCEEKALLGQILVHENICPERINEMIPILFSSTLPGYIILSQSLGKIVLLFVRYEEFMLKMFVMIDGDPEIIS